MSSQNNEEVFFLDDIGSPPAAPSRGLTSSPVQASSTTPTETANSSRGSSPTASPHRSVIDIPSVGQAQKSPGLSQAGPPPLLGPPIVPIAKPAPSSSMLLGSSPLLHKRPIYATPSAPSPLARASIVPQFSDCDSSSNDSAILSDEEEEVASTAAGRVADTREATIGPPAFAEREKFTLGSPRTFATERPSTTSYGGAVTPGALLKGKRSDSGSSQSQTSSSSGGVAVPHQRDQLTSTTYAPLYGGSPLSNQSYPRHRSESFGSFMGPLMNTDSSGGSRKRSDSIGSTTARSGVMPPGATVVGSALGLNPTTSDHQRAMEKGTQREAWPMDAALSGSLGTSIGTSLSLSPRASPRRERASVRASSSLTGESPIRSRRLSEFSHSGSEGRRLSVSSSSGLSRSLAAPIVPHAISQISPLNPLPSPWGNSGDDSRNTARSAHSDSSSSGGAIRLNRVPTSVRLATDLLKSTPSTPSSDSSMIIPPLSASTSRQASGDGRKHLETELVATIPSTPVATRNTTPEEVPVIESSPSDYPMLSSAIMMAADIPLSSGPARLPKAARRVRASLPPPSAFTPLNDPPAESPPLPEGLLSGVPHRTSWQGPFLDPGMAALGSRGEDLMASPRDRSHSDTDALTIQTTPRDTGREITLSTSLAGEEGSFSDYNDDAQGQIQTRRDSERSLDMTQGLADTAGDAARHANLIMQTRRAKIQKWRPASAETQKGPFGQEPSGKSVIPRLARTLSVPRLDNTAAMQSESPSAWDFGKGENTPAVQQLDTSIILLGPSQEGPVPCPSGLPISSRDGLSLRIPGAPADATGAATMEKSPSSNSNVNGIEWVDWLDEYKKYKEAKIRSEEEAARSSTTSTTRPSQHQQLIPEPMLQLPAPVQATAEESSTTKSLQHSPISPKQSIPQLPSPVDVSAKVVHSTRSHEAPPTKLSRALSQTGEMLQRTVSRTDAKRHPSLPSSATSTASLRQTSLSHKGASRKGKGLGNKIEGWWHSVKTNFQNPTVAHAPVPKILPFPPKGGQRTERQQAAYHKAAVKKIPSAPSSRRGSVMPLQPDDSAQPTALSGELSDNAHLLRTATSHTDLARLGESMPANQSLETDCVASSSPISVPALAHRQASDPTDSAVRSNLVQHVMPIQRAATGLEARRKQPALSLKLDNQMLALSLQSRRQQSGGSMAPPASAHSSSTGSLGFASRSEQESSASMPLGTRGWAQTPSPLQALNSRSAQNVISKPSPSGDSTGFNKVSVQRHVKHRLTVAKENCDKELQSIISEITAYVENYIQRERYLAADIPIEEEDHIEGADGEQLYIDNPPSVGSENITGTLDLDSGSVSLSRTSSMNVPRPLRSRQGSISLAGSPLRKRDLAAGSFRPDPLSPGRRTSVNPTTRTARAAEIGSRFGRSLELGSDAQSQVRSVSRSRSPMPPLRRLFTDESTDDSLVAGLQEIIAIATDVTEMTVSSLLSRPAECQAKVADVIALGELWKQHPDWPGKEWYYQLLLAVAALSRVVEWWESEKGFWNWDDEDDIGQFTFIMKPIRETESQFSSPTIAPRTHPEEVLHRSSAPPDPPAGSIAAAEAVLSPPSPGELKSDQKFARFEAIEDLQLQAEQAKSVNIVLELSLDGDTIEWVNPAWQEVLGTNPLENDTPSVSAWMAPADVDVLCNASRQLEQDDSHTAQARFRLLRAELSDDEDEDDREPGPTYLEFEGIGMLMRDRDTGSPTHTMWVIKPVHSSRPDQESDSESSDKEPQDASQSAVPLSADGIISSKNLLCRICEREVPTWFFEKHNETCNEVHRLEADISSINERLLELRTAVMGTKKDLETPGTSAAYQGIIITPRPKTEPDYRHGQVALAVQKIHQAFLEQALAILTEAYQISTPTIFEETANTPIRYQTLLSPTSEERLSRIGRWQKPSTNQPALQALFQDVDDLIRAKQRIVNRMRNTIVYSERVRQEWEDRVDRMLAIDEEASEGSLSSKGEVRDVSKEIVSTPATLGPGGADAVRAPDPHARLPVTLGRQQSQPTLPLTLNSENQPSPDWHGATDSITNTLFKPVSLRRISGSKTPMEGPLSPRLPPVATSRKQATSIKDFDIIKPISRGAFGSVFLAKKRTTGDYYAIKALRKQDMIAKNQITNVKAERTILMDQANSPYVAKLFWSFQSREYLYLVMEYLNGGDCAALIRTLGGLPEEWVKCYIAEVVLGLEYMHDRGVVHRDIKPDNLLIDAKGHLKLTDFGLSRAGLLNRQLGGSRPSALRSLSAKRKRGSQVTSTRRTTSPHLHPLSDESNATTPDVALPPSIGGLSQSYFSSHLTDAGSADESSGSEGISSHFSKGLSKGQEKPTPEGRKFVGTPDYLCPESILGFGTDDATVDWWALGVVMYEFLYGFPPFHDETPDKVFENIIARRINWYEDQIDISPEARDLMERLMCTDPLRRLGANGASEVKCHPFFTEIDWNTIATIEANFVPNVTDPESTDYFDARGALPQVFNEDEEEARHQLAESKNASQSSGLGMLSSTSKIEPSASTEDFGNFHFKNVHVLKEANDEQVRKLRKDSALQPEGILPGQIKDRRLSLAVGKKKKRHRLSVSENMPPSPSTSTSSSASTPGIPQTPYVLSPNPRRPSENRFSRVKAMHEWDEGAQKRSAIPSRAPAATTAEEPPSHSPTAYVDGPRQRHHSGQIGMGRSQSASGSPLMDSRKLSDSYTQSGSRAVDVLIAEDNPISQKICETLLTRMGCRCVCVNDGAEALAATMGSIRFDVIICDLVMPNVSGEEVARMIRSTNNPNVSTPIIAATSYEHKQIATVMAEAQREASGAIFNAILAKPITKRDLTDCLAKLGFVTGNGNVEVVPARAGYGRTASGRSLGETTSLQLQNVLVGSEDAKQSSLGEAMRTSSSADPVWAESAHSEPSLPAIVERKTEGV
ncbi:hypothetical protein NliqN6_2599 [Naganishia liquefaciens]|uniref:non-specific serine/threonine protein kinase n=1 Tax=Naganishia liquefaciens TaxID=104408 RepID=A0A8H3TS59_9TREE|nr:hypothetical protein NliqN6_2599 [Naganishia liquefaciens]